MKPVKLWDKGFTTNQQVEQFTAGKDRELDLELAQYDVEGSMAHIRMLESIGLLTKEELSTLLKGLENILTEINNKAFSIEEGVEDIHSQVELMLTRTLGEVGKKIHSGRSRNDQVLVDLKLFLRSEAQTIAQNTGSLTQLLLQLSEQHKNALMPGYTHYQIAMPSSFGLWFGGYAETLIDDLQQVLAAYRIANQNPLGSAAGYGSSFPLNREMTTELLGFEALHYNSIAAQMSRGKTERALASAMASIAATLSRLAGDICLFMCQNFGFVSFPNELTTGSSIMPHKKNPDVFELIRAHCNRLQALPNELAMVTTNLPVGYHRDFQLLKEILFPAIQELNTCLHMACFMLQHIKVEQHLLDDPKYDYLFTVEEVNRLVLQGVPFREAYKQVGEQVQNGTFKPNKQLSHTHSGSIGNLCTNKIQEKLQKVLAEIGVEKSL